MRKLRIDIGAVVSFTGVVRDDPANPVRLHTLTLEHYPAMTQGQLEDIACTAAARWPLLGITLVHRFGVLKPGEEIVLVVVASSHRQAAFEAASFLMDWLKTQAPFWKKETTSAGDAWVAPRARDAAAVQKWQAD